MEMTGLNPERDSILEIATIVTDDALNVVAEGPDLVINQPEEVLASMDSWSKSQHESSGLLDLVRSSLYDCYTAEKKTLAFVSEHEKKGSPPMCGNSVSTDREFSKRHMPRLEEFFHYRNIDVSTIKELFRRWYPSLAPYRKTKGHRALSDIKESINELRYYRQTVFLL